MRVPAAILVVGGVALAATLFLPYYEVQAGSSAGSKDLADLTPTSQVDYETRLIQAPPWLAGVLATAGATLLLPAVARSRQAVNGCATAALAAGFLLTLAGARWLGFYVARLLDNGPPPIHLQAAPYLELATGSAAVALLVPWLKTLGLRRIPTPVAAAGALLVLPLLPFAIQTAPPAYERYFDEWTLAVIQESGNQAPASAAANLGLHRAALWGALAMGILAEAARAGPIARLKLPWLPTLAHTLVLAPILLATGFLTRFLQQAPELAPQVTPWPNPVPWIGLAAIAVAWSWGWTKPSRRATAST